MNTATIATSSVTAPPAPGWRRSTQRLGAACSWLEQVVEELLRWRRAVAWSRWTCVGLGRGGRPALAAAQDASQELVEHARPSASGRPRGWWGRRPACARPWPAPCACRHGSRRRRRSSSSRPRGCGSPWPPATRPSSRWSGRAGRRCPAGRPEVLLALLEHRAGALVGGAIVGAGARERVDAQDVALGVAAVDGQRLPVGVVPEGLEAGEAVPAGGGPVGGLVRRGRRAASRAWVALDRALGVVHRLEELAQRLGEAGHVLAELLQRGHFLVASRVGRRCRRPRSGRGP